MEAQRVISVSLGKIAQSRLQRAGCSLHKSLMVASILHKARHLYVEQTFTLHCRAPLPPPPAPPAAAPEPEAEEEEGPTYTDLDACQPAARGVADLTCPAGAETDTTPAPAPEVRRKRLISDEETEEAVASILPKRARTDNGDDVKEAAVDAPVTTSTASSEDSAKESKDGGESDDSDDSCYESGDSDDSESDAMEIDRITSLVSVFSFDKLHRSSSVGDLVSASA